MSDDIIIASKHEAEDRAERIRTALSVSWDLIKDAWRAFDWQALGYPSWDAYCDGEFGTSRIRLPREERREVVSSMRELGMPIRAIASATGTSKSAVDRELSGGVPNGTPETVTGIDGKTYSSSQPERPRATTIPQSELDELNNAQTPEPGPEDDTPPQWEHVAQLPDAAVEQMKQDPQPIRVPEEDETEKDRLVELMSCIRKAERALKDAVYIAQRIEVWDGQKIGGDLHELIDIIDTTLTTGGLDGELARLIEGNQS